MFKNCFVRVNAVKRKLKNPLSYYNYSTFEHATLLYTGKVVVDNCTFISCSSYGNGINEDLVIGIHGSGYRMASQYEYLSIVHSNGGSIENCEFNNCT